MCRQDLDGDLAIQACVYCAINFPHSAAPEKIQNSVRTDRFRGLGSAPRTIIYESPLLGAFPKKPRHHELRQAINRCVISLDSARTVVTCASVYHRVPLDTDFPELSLQRCMAGPFTLAYAGERIGLLNLRPFLKKKLTAGSRRTRSLLKIIIKLRVLRGTPW